jgi:hypothetical protein
VLVGIDPAQKLNLELLFGLLFLTSRHVTPNPHIQQSTTNTHTNTQLNHRTHQSTTITTRDVTAFFESKGWATHLKIDEPAPMVSPICPHLLGTSPW